MKLPNWMKSKARKAHEAEVAAAVERARQEAAAHWVEQRREYEAEVAAANTPEKLEETGTAMLIDLIQNYPYVQVATAMYFGKKWRFGNIEFNSFYYTVEYREGLKSTHLFCVPLLQQATVNKALESRYQQLGGKDYVPVSDITPVAAKIANFEQRIRGGKNKLEKQEEIELSRYRRDAFMRLAQETLEKGK